MATSTPVHPFESLDDYLKAGRSYYESCLAHCDHDYEIDRVECTVRCHYVKFDDNKEPMFDALAEALFHHITLYCLSAKRRPTKYTEQSSIKLAAEARSLFRQHPQSGEAGELLLYFLLETVLAAPQVVCKMELKGNRKLEVHGGDGIHIRWDKAEDMLIVYLGEAKLYTSFRTAMQEALASVETITKPEERRHELNLIGSNFKYCDEELRRRIVAYIDRHSNVGRFQIRQACLIGFNWTEYKHLLTDKRDAFIQSFERRYLAHVRKLVKTTQELLDKFPHQHLKFDFFFLPFDKVQFLRDRFIAHLTGAI